MKDLVLYVHGKGGSPQESVHYRSLFPMCDVIGLEYQADTPWDAGKEIREKTLFLQEQYENIILIANSIGAFFSMHAGIDTMIRKAYFISPVTDMERLILNMMAWAGVSEQELREKGVIPTSFGEDLSWEYLSYVREHPIRWNADTEVLYGSQDRLVPYESVRAFAGQFHARLTVMEGGEHWFHTEEQMKFLDAWIRGSL